MSKESICLKVHKRSGQEALILANTLGLTDKTLLIHRNTDSLFIPLVREPNEREFATLREQLREFDVGSGLFSEKKGQEKTIRQLLHGVLAPHLLACLPKALDMVGDIAIIEIPPELDAYKTMVGEGVLKTNRNVRVVLAKAGKVSGIYRLREFEFIAGEHRTATLYKENGCSYYVDVAKTYFSPRLSHEHERVSSLVNDGEVVVDLFAGVGPFAVPIAKRNRNVQVYAIDINAAAVDLLKRNTRLNRVDNRVYSIEGDARQVVDEKLANKADRVIMNLPETAIEFVDVACKATRSSGGTLHFYGFIRAPDTVEGVKRSFSKAVETAGRNVNAFEYSKLVRETAPYEWQVVLDAKIR